MAAIHCPNGTTLQFGQHELPIGTAKTFWILARREGNYLVNIFLSADQGNTVSYQMLTKTVEATDKLVGELFAKTDAKMTFGFKAIIPNADGVTFEVSREGGDIFKRHVISHLFPRRSFDEKTTDDGIQFTCTHQGTEEEKIAKTKEILIQLSRKIDRFAVEKCLKENGDARFEIDFHAPISSGPSMIANPNHQSLRVFVIEADQIRSIHFNTRERSVEIPSSIEDINTYVLGGESELSRTVSGLQ